VSATRAEQGSIPDSEMTLIERFSGLKKFRFIDCSGLESLQTP
jgi:hypothetical protein